MALPPFQIQKEKTLEACDSSTLEYLISLYLKKKKKVEIKYFLYLHIHHFGAARAMHIWKIKTASMFLCLPLHQAVVHSAPRGGLLKLKVTSLFLSVTKIPFLPSFSEQKPILSGYQSSPDSGSLVLCSCCINRDPTVLKYTHLNCIPKHLYILTPIPTIFHISVPWLPNLESFHIPSGLDLEFCTQRFSRVSIYQVHKEQQQNLSAHQHSPVKSP